MTKEENNEKTQVHITNNFNAPIGQHIDHVDNIYFRMDKDGTFHFEHVEHIDCSVDDASENDALKRLARAVATVRNEGLLRHMYDYTWLLAATNDSEGMPTFASVREFLDFLHNMGEQQLPSSSSIEKKMNVFVGKLPDWHFTDCATQEATRRINIGRRLVNAWRKTETGENRNS